MKESTIDTLPEAGSRQGGSLCPPPAGTAAVRSVLPGELPGGKTAGGRDGDPEEPGRTIGLREGGSVAMPTPLLGENAENYRRFLRYLKQGQGMTQEQLAELLGVPQPTVSRLMRKFAWRARAEKFALMATSGDSTESVQWAERQGELREREWALHLELISAGIEALKRWRESSKIPNAGEIAKLIELGARLGRLAAGLPLGATEVSGSAVSPVRVELEVALEKVYGRVEKQVVEVEGVRAGEG